MNAPASSLPLIDHHPRMESFRAAVLSGLSKPNKTLPTALLYDERGSDLFEQICELPEYYPTRTEISILDDALPDISRRIGARAEVLEYGSGSSVKTRALLDAMDDPVAYVPVDISREHLLRAAAEVADRFPRLEVLPVCADFTRPFDLPESQDRPARRVVYFPGSTIGNFEPAAAARVLAQMRAHAGAGGRVLIGVDLVKGADLLEAAYDDEQGVTAAFNLNLLRRINDELGGDFDLSRFRHHAPWVPSRGAVEMRLVSTCPQVVHIEGHAIAFDEGEWIHTEDSHKYTLDGFSSLAGRAGLRVDHVWRDEQGLFSVQLLVPTEPGSAPLAS